MNAEIKGIALPPLSHIGFVVRDIEKTVEEFQRLFGGGPVRISEVAFDNGLHRGEPSSFRVKVASVRLGSLQLDLHEVIEGETILSEFLREKGEGVHHLAYHVADLEAEIAKFEKLGVPVLLTTTGTKRMAHMGTEPLIGTVIELLQRPPQS